MQRNRDDENRKKAKEKKTKRFSSDDLVGLGLWSMQRVSPFITKKTILLSSVHTKKKMYLAQTQVSWFFSCVLFVYWALMEVNCCIFTMIHDIKKANNSFLLSKKISDKRFRSHKKPHITLYKNKIGFEDNNDRRKNMNLFANNNSQQINEI